jgi:uncharacterized membrane protein
MTFEPIRPLAGDSAGPISIPFSRGSGSKFTRTRNLARNIRVEHLALFGVAFVYVAVVAYLCELRYENFLTLNWDLGLNQQMLWTTTHGKLLYESADLETYGFHSFLQVHSTYIALPIALVYGLAPTPGTLFVIQSAAFAASIFPLYLIARRSVTDQRLVFAIIVVYLICFAVISGLFYDYHWEAFIPVEFLSLFYLFERRRYAWSLVPASLGVLTLEVFPFLILGVVAFGLYNQLEGVEFQWERMIRDRRTRMLAGFLVFALASYGAIRILEYSVIPILIGQPSAASGIQTALSSFDALATLGTVSSSTVYWLLLLASFGMLPLLAPRFLLLSLPWLIESVFLQPVFSSGFGNQYSLIAIAPVAIAAVQGLGWIEKRSASTEAGARISVALVLTSILLVGSAALNGGSRVLLSGNVGPVNWLLLLLPLFGVLLIAPWRSTPEPPFPAFRTFTRARGRLRKSRTARRVLNRLPYALLCSVAILSVVMSPLNVTNFSATQYPGYSGFHWGENPMSVQMGWVLGFMPHNSQVLAADNLFPYIANNPNAYSTLWFPYTPSSAPFFPFSPNSTPEFVLADGSQFALLPLYLQVDVWNASDYGVVAFVFAMAYPGSVYLFEKGYTGPIGERVLSPTPNPYFFSGTNLSTGSSGQTVQNSSAKFGVSLDSKRADNSSGVGNSIWYGPYVGFLPGNYTVTMNLTGGRANSSVPSNTPVLFVNSGVYPLESDFYAASISAATLSSGPWVDLVFNITIPDPFPNVEFRGYLDYTNSEPNGYVALNYIEVSVRG